jgi:propanol-preferring alcohol dehydrogenase
MKAWIIDQICDLTAESHPLKLVELPKPEPQEGELLIKVITCGICHTEIDEIEGRTPPSLCPVVPGHQVVGTVGNPGNIPTSNGDRGDFWFVRPAEIVTSLSGENLCADFGNGKGQWICRIYGSEHYAHPIRFLPSTPKRRTGSALTPVGCSGGMSGEGSGWTDLGLRRIWLKLIRYSTRNRKYVCPQSQRKGVWLELGTMGGRHFDKPPCLSIVS